MLITSTLLIAGITNFISNVALRDSMEQGLVLAERMRQEALPRSAIRGIDGAALPAQWWTELQVRLSGSAELPPSYAFSSEALELAKATGVRLLGLSSLPQPSVPSALYRRMALKVELKGRYSAVKHWVAEMLGRHSGALAIRSMEIRRPDAPAGESSASEVEASIELYLFESISPSTVVTTPAASP